MTVLGHELTNEDMEVVFTYADTEKQTDVTWEANSGYQTVVLLNTHQDEELIGEGLSRELTNRIQKMRKDAKLHHIHVATAYCTFKSDGMLHQIANQFLDQISNITGTEIILNAEPTVKPNLAQSYKIQWLSKTMEEEFMVNFLRLLY